MFTEFSNNSSILLDHYRKDLCQCSSERLDNTYLVVQINDKIRQGSRRLVSGESPFPFRCGHNCSELMGQPEIVFSFGRSKTYSKSTHCVASASQPYIDAWQNAIPTPSFGAFMDNESFFIGVTFIIGLDVSVPHKCRCCAQIGKFGIQSLHRCSSAGRFPRHSGLNDAIKRCLGSAGFPCQLEPVSLGHLVPLQVSPNLGCYILY